MGHFKKQAPLGKNSLLFRVTPPGYFGFGGRLLQERVEWTKCVFAASAEAVEAENLFFVLGGPTSYMYT